MYERSNQHTQQCFAAFELSYCYGHRQQQQSSNHIMHKVPDITFWCKKSFVRVQSFTLRFIHQVSHTRTLNQMRHQALPGGVFQPLLLIGSIQIDIHLWSGVLLCFVRRKPSSPSAPLQRHTRYNTSYISYQDVDKKT